MRDLGVKSVGCFIRLKAGVREGERETHRETYRDTQKETQRHRTETDGEVAVVGRVFNSLRIAYLLG